VRLTDFAHHGLLIRVSGYQFPDADNLAERHSWHMVEGTAICPEGSWDFRFPALTCDESPRVASWLRQIANASPDQTPPPPLDFTEPNLSMAVISEKTSNAVSLQIGLDLEFAPPWSRRPAAGNPYLVRCRFTRQELHQAATEWEAEIALFPDQ